jgi:integrase
MTQLFSNNFESFLIKCGYKLGTIEKTYTILRTILNHYYDLKDDLLIDLSDKFRNKKFKKGIKSVNEPHPISRQEFDLLLKHDFKEPSLNKTKDRFLLQCSTGMRYSDLFKIRPEMINNECIEYYPQKTIHKRDNLVICPLNKISREILERYGFNTVQLDISNQKYNASLKLMFEKLHEKYSEVKFDTYTSHDARDTFITFALESNVPVPYLLKMVGQSSYEIMKRYFKESQEKLVENMNRVSLFNE